MTIRRFFSDDPITANTAIISGDEFHHLKNVNRAKCGDLIEVIDGLGSFYTGEIRTFKHHEAVIDLKEGVKTDKPPASVIIAPSLLKQQSMNWMIEKLAELGVHEIRPVMFQRTDDTYHSSRLSKWNRIALQSLKVNKVLWAPTIFPPVSVDELIGISESESVENRFLLDICGPGASSLRERVAQGSKGSVISVIGPPGGIVDEEREILTNNKFFPVKINACILKTETAAISIGAILKFSMEGVSAD